MWRIALVALVGCAHVAAGPPPGGPACRTALHAFATLKPHDFVPLPAICTIADADAVMKRLDRSPRGFMPADAEELSVRVHHYDFDGGRFTVWTRDGIVVAVDTWFHDNGGARFGIEARDVLAPVLGVPDEHRSFRDVYILEHDAVSVWYARGIAAYETFRWRMFSPVPEAIYEKTIETYEVGPFEDPPDD